MEEGTLPLTGEGVFNRDNKMTLRPSALYIPELMDIRSIVPPPPVEVVVALYRLAGFQLPPLVDQEEPDPVQGREPESDILDGG